MKDYLPLIGVLIGGSLSIIGGFVSSYLLECRKQATESKRIALAFRGEIQALLKIAVSRKYVQGIEQIIEAMERSGQELFVHIHVRRDYFGVYKSNVSNIGLLKNRLPELVARFYVQSNSVLEDLESYRDGSWASADVMSLIDSHKELKALLVDTELLGTEIVKEIDKLYS